MAQKAFIFDLDGVIVDTAKYHFLAWKKIAERLHIDFTLEDNELLKGVSRIDSLDIILRLGKVTASQEDKEKWLKEKNEDYLAYILEMDEREILPGVIDVLKYLKDKNQLVALGSASKNSKPILEKTKILKYFDCVIDGNDVSKAKPNPEVFLLAAKELGKAPSDCIVLEDSVAGIQAANIAKMTSIGIGDKAILHEAKYIFKDFTEMKFSFIDKIMING